MAYGHDKLRDVLKFFFFFNSAVGECDLELLHFIADTMQIVNRFQILFMHSNLVQYHWSTCTTGVGWGTMGIPSLLLTMVCWELGGKNH